MHGALRRAVWALRSPAGASSFWQASDEWAVRALSAAAIPAISTSLGRTSDAAPCAAGQPGSLVALTASSQSWSQVTHARPALSAEQLSSQSWGPRQHDVQLRLFASRPHSVAGRRAAAAQQRARSRLPPLRQDAPADARASAGSLKPDASGAQPPQQSPGPGAEVASGTTDAVEPLPASLHEV